MKPTEKHNEKIAKIIFGSVYPYYVAKVQKKGKTEEELITLITWLTGYEPDEIKKLIEDKVNFEHFFKHATLHPNAHLIKGSICGYKLEEIDNPLTKKVRYLDKIIDELAKGKSIDKIKR